MDSANYPLYLACERKNVDAVKFLLGHGANANSSLCPLVASARSGCELCIDLLLDHGADVNFVLNGETALHCACRAGHFLVAEQLLNRGANPRAGEEQIQNLVNIIVVQLEKRHTCDPLSRQGVKVVCLLSKMGVDIKEGVDDVFLLIQLLLRHQFFDVAKNVLLDLDVNLLQACDWLFYYAARCDWFDIVKLLLDKGVNIDSICILNRANDVKSLCKVEANEEQCVDDDGDEPSQKCFCLDPSHSVSNPERATALIGACEAGNERMIRFLLSRGASPNFAPGDCVPIISAVSSGCIGAVRILVEAGAALDVMGKVRRNVTCKRIEGHAVRPIRTSALHVACECQYVDIVRLLLGVGAGVNVQDGRCGTPLYIATRVRHSEIVGVLLENGADVNEKDGEGETAVGILCKNLSHSGSTGCNGKEQPRPQESIKSTLDLLLNHGAQVDSLNGPQGDETPLYRACSSPHLDVIQTLLEHGAKPDGTLTKSPLCLACVNSQADAVQMLLRYGADGNRCQVSRSGNNCLFPLCIAAEANDVGIVKALLKSGALVECAVDYMGRTVLHQAVGAIKQIHPCESKRLDGRPYVIRMLLEHSADPNAVDRRRETPVQCAVRNILASSLRIYSNALEKDLHMRSGVRLDVNTYRRVILPVISNLVRAQVTCIADMLNSGMLLNDAGCPDVVDNSQDLACYFKCNPIGRYLVKIFMKAGAQVKWLAWIAAECYSDLFSGDDSTVELCKAIVLAGNKGSILEAHTGVEQKLKEWLDGERGTIPRLMSLCRVAIRRHLFDMVGKRSICDAVYGLPLPEELGEFLHFEGPLADVQIAEFRIDDDDVLLRMLKLR